MRLLFLRRHKCRFAEKPIIMLWKKYVEFARLYCAGLAGSDYRSLCRRLRVSPADLDEVLVEELGAGGEEILSKTVTFIKFAD